MIFNDHQFYNCKIKLSNHQEFKIEANWIHTYNLDLWEGWLCSAGQDRILIDFDLKVYSGECKNDYLGDLVGDWNILDNPTVCNKKTCTGCTDDLITTKQRPNNVN